MKKKLLLWHPESPGMRVVVRRGPIKRLLYPVAFATLSETLKSSRVDLTQSDKFVAHIAAHLPPGEDVVCKICGKSVDEIAKEADL